MPTAELTPLWLTLKVASLVTLRAFVFSIVLALLLARSRFPGKDWLEAVLTLPLVLPPTVLGYYLIVLVGRRGWLGQIAILEKVRKAYLTGLSR